MECNQQLLVFLGHSGCMWHLTWIARDQGTKGDRLSERFGGWRGDVPGVSSAFAIFSCSVAGCCSPDVFSSEYVRSCCTNLSHCHHISISVIT